MSTYSSKRNLLLNIPKYINALKTITSREIRRKFPEVKKKLWKNAFWFPSYFLATSGQVIIFLPIASVIFLLLLDIFQPLEVKI